MPPFYTPLIMPCFLKATSVEKRGATKWISYSDWTYRDGFKEKKNLCSACNDWTAATNVNHWKNNTRKQSTKPKCETMMSRLMMGKHRVWITDSTWGRVCRCSYVNVQSDDSCWDNNALCFQISRCNSGIIPISVLWKNTVFLKLQPVSVAESSF